MSETARGGGGGREERTGEGERVERAGVGVALVMRGREEAEKMVVWASEGPRRRVSAMKRVEPRVSGGRPFNTSSVVLFSRWR